MPQVTVGSKYQIVIPKEVRRKIKGLQPGAKVSVHQQDVQTLTIRIPKKSWSDETYGFMKKSWKGFDPIAEIEKMRDEWDQKV